MSNTVVTIETGLGCNNRCDHCPQPAIRAAGPVTQPSSQEIRLKIDAARGEGCTRISFSGGEPTIRKDIAEMVSYARASGMEQVSITTNGRMFAVPGFAEIMLRAGLTGVSVSLHGPDAATHEALTSVPGSFDQALSGMKRLKELTLDRGVDFNISSITVLVPGNIGRLRETLLLAETLGARLHIVQPFILSKEVLDRGSRFILGINEIVSGIRRALDGGLPDGRVKPYNIPPCLLQDMGSDIEVQSYRLRTIREFDPVDGTSTVGMVKGQFFRFAQCSDCDAICPGLRVEHLSQRSMVRMILADITASRPSGLPRNAALSSIDLLGAQALDGILTELALAGASAPVLYWGGMGLCPPSDMLRLCRKHNVSSLILLARPPQQRPPDARVFTPGNIPAIREVLSLMKPGQGPEPVVFTMINNIFTDQSAFTREELMVLLRALRDAGGKKVILSAPDRIDIRLPAHSENLKKLISDQLPEVLDEMHNLGLDVFLAGTGDAQIEGHGEPLESKVARLITPINLHDEFLRHRFATPENGWVMWSYPVWISNLISDFGAPR